MSSQNIVITEKNGETIAESLPIIQPKENELLTLTHAVVEWKKLNSEISELGEQVKERRKKQKALQEIILRIMKSHNIGALDLKSSGGRVMYKKKKGKGKKKISVTIKSESFFNFFETVDTEKKEKK